MYLIRLDRPSTGLLPSVHWLTGIEPMRWGARAAALRFPTDADARRIAESCRILGDGYTIESDPPG